MFSMTRTTTLMSYDGKVIMVIPNEDGGLIVHFKTPAKVGSEEVEVLTFSPQQAPRVRAILEPLVTHIQILVS